MFEDKSITKQTKIFKNKIEFLESMYGWYIRVLALFETV